MQDSGEEQFFPTVTLAIVLLSLTNRREGINGDDEKGIIQAPSSCKKLPLYDNMMKLSFYWSDVSSEM